MKHYDIVFLSRIPTFYKINLYNGIAAKRAVLSIHTDLTDADRNADFAAGNPIYDCVYLRSKGVCNRLNELRKLLMSIEYDELIISGWESFEMWAGAFISPRSKNSVVCESSYFESVTTGWKAALKRLYLSRISTAYVSGKSQTKLLKLLRFRGQYIVTKGVGVFNRLPQPVYEEKKEVKNFLYVGRFVKVKNLRLLIDTFSRLPKLNLYLVGFGVLEEELKGVAGSNIHFLGAIDNKRLPEVYRKMDVLVLPSINEPWGLVVEEALNNGLPVIVSDRVGCAEEIVDKTNGLVFNHKSSNGLIKALLCMCDINYYNNLRKNISKLDFGKIESEQIAKYIRS